MPLLVALAWKSALLCVAALGAIRAMRRRPAAERVVLLRVTLAALLALPVLTLALPAAEVPLLPARERAAATELATSLPQQRAVITQRMPRAEPVAEPSALVGSLYLGGVALVLLHLAIGIAILAHWTRCGRPLADRQWQAALARNRPGRRPVRLLESARANMPLSWGVAPAWILIDADTAARPDQAESVIAHETAHIRRFDWLALLMAQLAVALFWFNPLVWLVRQRLMQEAELTADGDAVREIARADYAQVLLSVAARPAGPRAANGMALVRRALPHRIATLLEGAEPRRANRVVAVALLLCGLGATAPLAAMKLVPVASPMQPEVTLRTTSTARVPGPRKVTVDHERAAAVLEAVAWREKPRVEAAPTAPPAPRAPTPTPRASAAQPGAIVLSKGDRLVVLMPAPQQVVVSGPEEEGRRSAEEGRRAAEEGRRQGIESRAEAAESLMNTAENLRNQAENLEESANEDDLPASAQAEHRRAAQSIRAQAAKLEKEAAALLGTP